MKIQLTMIVLLTTLTLTSWGKNNGHRAVSSSADTAYIKSLEERQIGGSKYSVFLPTDYAIKETNGGDFSIYSFYPTDTTNHTGFSGGFYFGNHPSQFPAKSKSCKTAYLKSEILDQNVKWTIYNCNGNYLIQTITNSKSGEGWNELIHIFGNAKSTKDLDKLLFIFTTIKKKE
ncbi:hypothetical protein [Sphingobacterium siyangense]|uniref:hypothetical protein n=1 Tax=Sphingobacterium siyangense TaxID=459529 RepID=UPI00196455C9|nr:hypothetical protein [Sphingobacterium siyangense]QRY60430.1 hypothetical protein JVX97_13685 [Sphingobacterium siyangense]